MLVAEEPLDVGWRSVLAQSDLRLKMGHRGRFICSGGLEVWLQKAVEVAGCCGLGGDWLL
jgi:hypothetical protein